MKSIPTTIKQEVKKVLIFHQQNELRKNQVDVHMLYIEILREFIEKLMKNFEKESKCSQNETKTFHNSEQIQKFYSAIKYYYNQTLHFYNHSVRQRQGGSRVEEFHFKSIDLTFESRQTDKESQNKEAELFTFQMPDLFKSEAEKPLFSFPPLSIQTLKEDLFQEKQNSRSTSSSDSDSEEDEFSDYAVKAQKCTNGILIGNFMSSKIKRKPKEEKIYLDMHDVLLKCAHNGRDAFYDRASIELKKVEKSEVPIQ